MKVKTQTKTQIKSFLKWLLFPAQCPSCKAVLPMDSEGFCPDCAKNLRFVKEPVCFKCGCELSAGEREYCDTCLGIRHSFYRNVSCYVYSKAAKQAMYRLKYGGAKWIAKIFAREMVKRNRGFILNAALECIVPAPMHEKKERERGYDQAKVLAYALSEEIKRQCGKDVEVVCLVKRQRYTTPQKGLSATEGRRNLKKAFQLDKNVVELKGYYSDRKSPLYGSVLLVDDIYTTGATLDAISEVLVGAGLSGRIYCMTAMIGAAA